MAIKLGSAYGKVDLDVKGLMSAVKQGQGGLKDLAAVGMKVGQTMQMVGNTLTLGLTLPIAALGAASIKAAGSFEETKNKATVVFEEMADSVIENADKASQALGVGKQKYLDYASSIGAALKAGGMSIKETTKLSEDAVKHMSDLASFHEANIEDVSRAWQSAIRGQYEPIQKYFPFITNQFLITYGTANGMLDANTKQLTANQRAVILNAIAFNEELNPALDDFSETSDSLANTTRRSKEEFNNLLITVGTNFIPIATKVVSTINDMLVTFNNMSPAMQKAVIGFLGFLALLGPVLSFVGTIISIVSGLAGMGVTLSGVGAAFGTIGTAITGTLIPALGALLAPLAGILLPILLIIGTLALLYLAFKNNFMGITTTAKQLWYIIKWGFAQMWEALKSGTATALENIKTAWEEWQENNQETFQGWVEWMQNAWENVLDYFAKVRDWIVNLFQNVDWSAIGRAIIDGLTFGLYSGMGDFFNAITEIVNGAMDLFDGLLDMGSPSGEFKKRGLWSMQGYLQGWKEMDPKAVAQAMARPILGQGSTSSQQTISMNFANGLTIRQVKDMIANNNERILADLSQAIAGA